MLHRTSITPGAGFGPVHHAASSDDLPGVPHDCVLMAPRPFPGLVSVLTKISALVTEIGGLASHTATLQAREYGVDVFYAEGNEAGAEFNDICRDHSDYMWDSLLPSG